MGRPKDKRYVAELPSGIIKKPVLRVAACDLWVNDVVYIKDEQVYPMYDESQEMYGVVAANQVAGRRVVVAS